MEVTAKYVLKYIEKSGERLVYGGDLPEYIDCNILAEDVVCPIGKEDRKILLFDDFTCIDKDGVVRGKASSPEVLAQMPKQIESILSFAVRSVNENALAVKDKVHCLAATLDRQESQMLHRIMAYYYLQT